MYKNSQGKPQNAKVKLKKFTKKSSWYILEKPKSFLIKLNENMKGRLKMLNQLLKNQNLFSEE